MKTVICIELGELFLKACEVDVHDDGTMYIVQDFCCDIPMQCCKDGYPTMIEYLVYTIQEELGDVLNHTDDICFTIASQRITHRSIDIAVSEHIQEDIDSMFDLLFPELPNGQYICKYLINNRMCVNNDSMKLDVFALPFNLVEQYYRLAYEIGKNCISIVDSGFAIKHIYEKYFNNANNVLVELTEHSANLYLYQNGVIVDSFKYNESLLIEMLMPIHDSDLAVDSLTMTDTLSLMKENIILGKHSKQYIDDRFIEVVNDAFNQFCLKLEKQIALLCQKNNFTFSNCFITGFGPDIAHFNVELQKRLHVPISQLNFQKSLLVGAPDMQFPSLNVACACAACNAINLININGEIQTPIINTTCQLQDFYNKK